MLRTGLLSGRAVALAGDIDPEVYSALRSLGASLAGLPPGELDDDRAQEWVRSAAPLDALVVGTTRGAGERLESALDRTWTVVHAVAADAFIAQAQPGKIVLLAPPPDSGEYTAALRSALENLARTLSVEWARYSVTVTAITPGARTSAAQSATVVAFLLSPAGDYFSGCRLELGAGSA